MKPYTPRDVLCRCGCGLYFRPAHRSDQKYLNPAHKTAAWRRRKVTK